MRNNPMLTEDTRFNLKFSNIWALVATVIMLAGVVSLFDKRISMVEAKLDTLISMQKENAEEFKGWKIQAETRIGTVESRQNSVISYLENHLQVNIR